MLALAACGEEDAPMEAVTVGGCGGTLPEQDPHADLTLTGAFPERVRTERSTVEGTVTITNATSRRIDGLAASQPDVYVTQGGRIVAEPLPSDDVGLALELAPGAARDFSATGSLRGCSDQQPLPPGRYELHAVLRVGEATAAGGPWPLEIARGGSP